MVSLNNRLRSVVLALTLLVTGQVSASWSMADVTAAMPTMPTMPITAKGAAFVFACVCYIRLYTKPSCETLGYQSADFHDDVKSVMSSLNIFDAELYAKVIQMFDKWIIGRKLTLVDSTTRTREEDGKVVAIKDKKLKCTAFGALGLFDAYVLQQIDKLSTVSGNLTKLNGLYTSYNN